MSSIAFFVHFDIHNRVDAYVIHLLTTINQHVDELVVISHANLNQAGQSLLKDHS